LDVKSWLLPALLFDILGSLVEIEDKEFSEVSQQVLIDHLIAKVCVLKLAELKMLGSKHKVARRG
jgi:hypothetical protein